MRPVSAHRFEERVRGNRLVGRLLGNRAVQLLRQAREDDLGVHLLAVSAQQLLCTAPLAVALAAVSQRATGVSIAEVLTHVLQLTPRAQHVVTASFAGSSHVSLTALWTNLLIAVAFGVGVAASLQRGLEMIWRLPRSPALPSVLRQSLWAVMLPLLITATVVIGRGSHQMHHARTLIVVLGFIAQIVLVAVFGWWTQRLLLARRVGWHRLWPSVGFFLVALTVVLVLARFLISGQLVSAHRAYGDVGLLIVLSAWVGVATTSTMSALTLGSWLRRDHELDRGSTAVYPPSSALDRVDPVDGVHLPGVTAEDVVDSRS
ncbi:hypothetical protein [uncultured Jatrophihabitans sp.]|uniref:hypothetical protein n=1 Tax=uncultured Jatrophihabitans sp. TaxID=1610747 RepID=UPI0035CB7472